MDEVTRSLNNHEIVNVVGIRDRESVRNINWVQDYVITAGPSSAIVLKGGGAGSSDPICRQV